MNATKPTKDKPNKNNETKLDSALRPKNINEFIGQSKAKKSLKIIIQAAQQRKEPIEHTLIYGPPGLGKTSLAHILAQEMNVNIRVTSGPALERAGDLASILTNLEQGDILFIDEIHRLHKTIEECLYPAMEDYCLDIIIGKGPSARTLRMDLPKFTIVGATTRIGLISSPLRDRFGIVHKLDYYKTEELSQIITKNASLINIKINTDSAEKIAQRSRGTPRIANRLLKRFRDVAQINNSSHITDSVIKKSIEILEIDEIGLNYTDIKYLKTIAQNFQGGPVGLSTIAAAISEDTQTIEEVIEPYLLKTGMIKRTPRGRELTKKAYQHIKIEKNLTKSN